LAQTVQMIRKNILSIVVALVILYLSLAGSQTFDSVPLFNIPYFDKVVHFLMYAGFMSVILFENRKNLIRLSRIFLLALIPFFYGILMEILQAALTETRSGNIYDALSDSAGIITVVLLWYYLKPVLFPYSDSK
jgi:VanZ family protein